MPALPIMPFIAVALLALPVKLAPRSLGWLAFGLWLLGGAVLLSLGTARLLHAERDGATPALIVGIAVAALAVGATKGWFILRKTARRNIDRLAALTEARRPIHVYGARSWTVIGLMTALSIGLTLGGVPPLWGGRVTLAIGAALATSSLNYLPPLRAGLLRSPTS